MLVSDARFFFRMRDHAFFFGGGFLLFKLGVFGIVRIVFRGMVLFGGAQSCSLGDGVGFGKAALLRIAGGQLILRVGNMFGDGAGFVFRQLGVRVVFVMFRFEGRGRFVGIKGLVVNGRFGFFHVIVRSRHGIHFRSRGYERRERREADRVWNRRFIEPLSLGFRRFGRKMLMGFPFRERFAG